MRLKPHAPQRTEPIEATVGSHLEKEIGMQHNEGTVDRALRIIVGILLLGAAFVGPKTPLGWLGVIPLATGLVGFCPLYRLIGIKTTKSA